MVSPTNIVGNCHVTEIVERRERVMNRGLIGTIIGVLVVIILVIVILQLT